MCKRISLNLPDGITDKLSHIQRKVIFIELRDIYHAIENLKKLSREIDEESKEIIVSYIDQLNLLIIDKHAETGCSLKKIN